MLAMANYMDDEAARSQEEIPLSTNRSWRLMSRSMVNERFRAFKS
jgi:hypothetical protein